MPHIPKSYDAGILNYLKKPINLPLVLQIGDYATKIREDIPREFLSDVVRGLNASRFSLHSVSGSQFQPPASNDFGIEMLTLRPAGFPKKRLHALSFALEIENSEDEFYVWVGAAWNKSEKQNSAIYNLSEVANLRDAMEEDENGYEFSPPFWLCGRYTWAPSSRDKFLRAYAEASKKIVATTVESYCRMVRRHFTQLEKVNKTLQKFKR